MHLVRCSSPQEPLEEAPRSALLTDTAAGERWESFWASDAYYVRCISEGGDITWFQVADDITAEASEPRVLTLRTKTRQRSRVSVVVAQSPDGRRMLVGGSARRSAR